MLDKDMHGASPGRPGGTSAGCWFWKGEVVHLLSRDVVLVHEYICWAAQGHGAGPGRPGSTYICMLGRDMVLVLGGLVHATSAGQAVHLLGRDVVLAVHLLGRNVVLVLRPAGQG